MSVNLILLADGAASNEIFHKGGETRPPKVTVEDGLGVEDTHMAHKGRRMDRMKESRPGRGGNKHAISEVEMSIVVGPV